MVTIFRVYVSYMYSLLGIYLKFLYTLMLFVQYILYYKTCNSKAVLYLHIYVSRFLVENERGCFFV